MKLRTLRRAYLREAIVTLIAARLAVRFIPVNRIFAWANKPPRRIDRFASDEIARVSWAIETARDKWWMDTPSLPQSLAAHAMLRRRGIASRFCLGLEREHGALVMHTWVEVGQATVFGSGHAPRAKRLAEFGGRR